MTAHLLDKQSYKDLNDVINDLGFSSQNDDLQPIKSESKWGHCDKDESKWDNLIGIRVTFRKQPATGEREMWIFLQILRRKSSP